MLGLRFLVVVACLWSAAAVADDVSAWLMKMNDAATNLSYHGTFVYGYESNLEAMRVVHQVEDGVVRERIYALNGAPREIIRDAERVWCYVPEQNMGVHEFRQVSKPGFPNILPRSMDQLTEHYTLKLGRVNRVADRLAQQILILPLDEFRYGYALWADQETGLLLKSTLMKNGRVPIEQYMFTQVDIGVSIPEQALTPLTPKEDLKWFGPGGESKESIHVDLAAPGWQVGKVPEGFKATRQIKRLSPIRQTLMEQYVYSDGLAAVSIFIEMIGNHADPQIEGVSRMGAVHAFGHTQDGYHITVVGEVPAATVDLIGMSVSKMPQ